VDQFPSGVLAHFPSGASNTQFLRNAPRRIVAEITTRQRRREVPVTQ
jgi:hypothetical protein